MRPPGRHRPHAAPAAAWLLACLALVASAAAGERIVAVGDVHGDREGLRGILGEAGLIDAAGSWSGGDATLVQTGDFLDRGPSFRGVMDFLRRLQEEAPRHGGRVVVLLGNHEAMNLLGDLRYVTAGNFAEFAGQDPGGRQDAAWRDYDRWRRARAVRLGLPPPEGGAEDERSWRERHPPGWFDQRDALGPGGDYGRWLRGLPAAARIGDVAFVHGGISPALAGRTPEEIAERAAADLALWDRQRERLVAEGVIPPYATLDETFAAVAEELAAARAAASPDPDRVRLLEAVAASGDSYLQHPDGPLWFRGYALWSDEEGPALLAPVLAGSGVGRLVVGHSPTDDGRVHVRFDGAVFLIDTGMLRSHYPGGRASALEIHGGRATAIYPGERAVLVEAPGPSGSADRDARAGRRFLGPDGEPLPFTTDEQVLAFLRTARVVEQERIRAGINQPWKLLLEQDGVRAHAVFRDVDLEQDVVYLQGKREMFFRDSYLFEPAAYELARSLGLDNVPPSALRQVGATPGSVQLWIERAMTEEKRTREGIQPPDVDAWNRSMETVRLFDALIRNTDRNAGNLLIDADWNLWMIDHTRAFRRDQDIPDDPGFARCDRELYGRLQALDAAATLERLAPYLRKHEIRAILARRDKLIARIQALVAQRGEEAVLFGPAGP